MISNDDLMSLSMGFRDLRKEFKTQWNFRKRTDFWIIIREKVHKSYSTLWILKRYEGQKNVIWIDINYLLSVSPQHKVNIYTYCYRYISRPDYGLLPQTYPDSSNIQHAHNCYFSQIQTGHSETHQAQDFWIRDWGPAPLLWILVYQWHNLLERAHRGHDL